MPEQVALSDFMRDTWDDFKSPTTSSFTKNMSSYKSFVSSLEEVSKQFNSVLVELNLFLSETKQLLVNTANSERIITFFIFE